MHERGEFAAGRCAESTIAHLLDTVGDSADKQVSAEPRRLASIKPPPLFAQFIGSERGKRFKNPRHLRVTNLTICFDHGIRSRSKCDFGEAPRPAFPIRG
jgi:hypothetical protein